MTRKELTDMIEKKGKELMDFLEREMNTQDPYSDWERSYFCDYLGYMLEWGDHGLEKKLTENKSTEEITHITEEDIKREFELMMEEVRKFIDIWNGEDDIGREEFEDFYRYILIDKAYLEFSIIKEKREEEIFAMINEYTTTISKEVLEFCSEELEEQLKEFKEELEDSYHDILDGTYIPLLLDGRSYHYMLHKMYDDKIEELKRLIMFE